MGLEDLAGKVCVACKGGVPPLKGDALRKLGSELGNGWQVVETFLPRADFGQGLDPPIRAVAEIETARDGWRYCVVTSRVAAWK